MKKLIFIISLISLTFKSYTQSTVNTQDLIQKEWKMVIDVKEAAKEELEKEDDFFGEMIAKSVLGIVDEVLEEIDIRMHFLSDGKLKMIVNAMDENDVKYGTWKIKDGKLYFSIPESDDDEFKISTDGDFEYWLLAKDVLLPYTESGKLTKGCYIVKL